MYNKIYIFVIEIQFITTLYRLYKYIQKPIN